MRVARGLLSFFNVFSCDNYYVRRSYENNNMNELADLLVPRPAHLPYLLNSPSLTGLRTRLKTEPL